MSDYSRESFESLLENLADPEQPLRAALLYRLSDLAPVEMLALQAIWSEVPVERRRQLVSRLVETSEVSIDVDYREVARFTLQDDDPEVRRRSIEALWEDERPETMRALISHVEFDSDPDVRAEAAQALGRFVLAGEMGELPEQIANEAVDALLEILLHGDEHLEVHRRSLESIAYASRDEIASLIEEAMENVELKMRASAVFAMGRSADEQWTDAVLSALHSDEAEIVYEAARAAGELMLEDAVGDLIRLAAGDDTEIKMSAIWSLGEIGGHEARRALMELADSNADDPILDAIEDAMNMAALSTGDFATYLLSSNGEAFEGTDLLDDLDEE